MENSLASFNVKHLISVFSGVLLAVGQLGKLEALLFAPDVA